MTSEQQQKARGVEDLSLGNGKQWKIYRCGRQSCRLLLPSHLDPPHFQYTACNRWRGIRCPTPEDLVSEIHTLESCNDNREYHSDCPAGCVSNRVVSDHIVHDFELRWSDLTGWGLFALRNYQSGEVVCEYTGEVLRQEEYQAKLNAMKTKGQSQFYMLNIEKTKLAIDASKFGSPARFVNHKCMNANGHYTFWYSQKQTHMVIRAQRDINIGEEITCSYGAEYDQVINSQCHCGEEKCRGYMGAPVTDDDIISQLDTLHSHIASGDRADSPIDLVSDDDNDTEPSLSTVGPDWGHYKWGEWRNRFCPQPPAILEHMIRQYNDSQRIGNCKGEGIPLSNMTHLQWNELRSGTASTAVEGGLLSLAINSWLSGDAIDFALQLIAELGELGWDAQQPKRGNVTILNTRAFDWIKAKRRLRGISQIEQKLLLFPINIENTHWVTGMVDGPSKQIAVIDALGVERPNLVNVIKEWLNSQGIDISAWTVLTGFPPRQTNGKDCGVFTVCDIWAVADGSKELIQQSATDWMREKIVYLIWLSGDMTLQINNECIDPEATRLAGGRRNLTSVIMPTPQQRLVTTWPELPAIACSQPEVKAKKLVWAQTTLSDISITKEPKQRSLSEKSEQLPREHFVRQEGTWTISSRPLVKGGKLWTINIGPVGFWTIIHELLMAIGDQKPGVIMLQDLRLRDTAIAHAKKYLKKYLPIYASWFSTRRVRDNIDGKRKKGQWVGVLTLIHKELMPEQHAKQPTSMGVKDGNKHLQGRLIINQLGGSDAPGYILNVYQYTSGQTDDHNWFRDLLQQIIEHLQTKGGWILIGGDFNAAQFGSRQFYRNRHWEVDEMLDAWIQRLNLTEIVTPQPTFTGTSGCQASLDRVFVWGTNSDNDEQTSASTINNFHPSCDHKGVEVQVCNRIWEAISDDQPTIRTVMDFRGWKEDGRASNFRTAVRKMAGPPDSVGSLEQLLTISWQVAQTLVGVRRGRGKPCQSLQQRRWLKVISSLKKALSEARKGIWGTRAIRLVWRQMELGQIFAETIPTSKETLLMAIRVAIKMTSKQYSNEVRRMRTQQYKETQIWRSSRLWLAGAHEMQRLFGKELPKLTMWGILPRNPQRRYPNTIEGGKDLMQHVQQWLGMPALCSNNSWPITYSNARVQVTISKDGSDDQWSLRFQPVSWIYRCLSSLSGQAIPIKIKYTGGEKPFKIREDKLSQIEYYVAQEGAALNNSCRQCSSQRIIPLSDWDESGKRLTHWWCLECNNNTTPDDGPVSADGAEEMGLNFFSGEQILSVKADISALDYALDTLPNFKAAGIDDIPYEILKEIPREYRGKPMLTDLNNIIDGGAIPEQWKIAIIRYLFKREPSYQLENLRPVALQCTPFKVLCKITNDRLQAAIDESGVVGPTQHAGVRRRHSHTAISVLQYTIHEQERQGGKIYVAYLDIFGAFNSVTLSQLFAMLRKMKMHEKDIQLLERLLSEHKVVVDTPLGRTAVVDLLRGLEQGNPLSSTLFTLFMTVCLKFLQKCGAGIAFRARHPTRDESLHNNNTAFMDDIALMATTIAAMNQLLERVRQFCAFAGLKLSVSKCKASAFDFQSRRELPVTAIWYGNEPLSYLPCNEAFRYLGVRTDVRGSVREEREYIITTVRQRANALRKHPYTIEQARTLIRAAIHPVVTYSASHAGWNQQSLLNLDWAISQAHKAAWTLTKSHNTAPFLLPQEHGGVIIHPATVDVAHELIRALLRNEQTGDVLLNQLMLEEWKSLTADWNSQSPRDIQLGLLLMQFHNEIYTPVASALLVAAINGITFEWGKLGMGTHGGQDRSGLMGFLEKYIVNLISRIWTGKIKSSEAHQLGLGLKKLSSLKHTPQSLQVHGSWSVHLPMKQQLAVLKALEAAEPGIKRLSIRSEIQRMNANAEQHNHGNSAMRPTTVGQPTVPEASEAAHGDSKSSERPKQHASDSEDDDEEAEPEQEKACPVNKARIWRKVRRRTQQDWGLGPLLNKVISFDKSSNTYDCLVTVPSFNTALSDDELARALIKCPGVLLRKDSQLTSCWNDDDNLDIPHRNVGWFVKYEMIIDAHNGLQLVGFFLDPTRRQRKVIRDRHDLSLIREALWQADADLQIKLNEQELGFQTYKAGISMHRLLFDYWQTRRQEAPQTIANRITAYEQLRERRAGNHNDHEEPEKKQAIIGLPPIANIPDRTPLESETIARTKPIKCMCWMNDHISEFDAAGGTWSIGKGIAKWTRSDGAIFRAQQATVELWRKKNRLNWSQLAPKFQTDINRMLELEEGGYKTMAWSALHQIAGHLHRIAGPPRVSCPPFFTHAEPAHEGPPTNNDGTLIILDCYDFDEQLDIVMTLAPDQEWSIVADKHLLHPEVFDHLTSMWEGHAVLQPTGEGKEKSHVAQFFKKNWWTTGDIGVVQGKQKEMWVWNSGRETVQVDKPSGAPQIPNDTINQHWTKLYIESLPSGAFKDIPGDVYWVDGAKLKQKDGVESVGAGGFHRDKPCNSFHHRVGGEASAPRGEIAAATTAAKNTKHDRRLTIFTDSKMLLFILRRWMRGDFRPTPRDEKHWDILQELLDVLRMRTEPTYFIWVKAHAGDTGNEEADRLAKMGALCDDVRWERTTNPLKIVRADTGEPLSPHGWNLATQNHARTTWGESRKQWLKAKSSSIATTSLLKDDRGRQYLGAVLQDKSIPERVRRILLQARSFCYPSRSVVGRWKGWDDNKKRCRLCHQHLDTFGHEQTSCPLMQDVYRTAHNDVANAFCDKLTIASKGKVRVVQECTARNFLDKCPKAIRNKRPDAFFIFEDEQKLVIADFQRGWADHCCDFDWRKGEKRRTYHLLWQAAIKNFTGWQVVIQPYIIGVLTSIEEGLWKSQLAFLGIKDTEADRVIEATVRATVLALGKVADAYRASEKVVGEAEDSD